MYRPLYRASRIKFLPVAPLTMLCVLMSDLAAYR